MFDKLKSLLGKTPAPEQPEMPDVGAITGITPHLPMLGLSGFGLKNGSYDNTYPSISRIADAIAEVEPIAIDASGKEVKHAHLLEVLNHPNKEMCSTDFMEALAVMLLVHPKVHLLVWRKGANGELEAGGNITEQNIAGLTFMEDVSERIVGGKSEYGINGKVFTEDEVISLSLAVNPYHLADGYSPSVASKKWATTDDYIAEYHNAQFRNNARPAGMLTIVADSAEEFNEAVDTIEAKFRGASNAGNTIYNMRPSQTLEGKPAPAKIEWTPFAQTNKDLTLEPVYNQANRKLESVFGVPEEVRGHLQNSNYASAEVADYIFSRRVIYPMLVKIYSKLTHELNRVTGGMGYALSFHYEVPMLTDTRKLQAEALKTMIDAGFTVESSVEALRLPESYKGLQKEQKASKTDTADKSELMTITKSLDIEEPEEPPTFTRQKEDLVSPNLLVAYDHITRSIITHIADEVSALIEANAEDNLEKQLDALEASLLRAFENDTKIQKDIQSIQTELDGLRQTHQTAQEVVLTEQLGVDVSYTSTEIKTRVAEIVAGDLQDSYKAMTHNLLNATALIIYNQEPDDTDGIYEELERLAERQHWRAVRFGFTEQQLVIGFVAQAMWEWAQKEYNFKGYKTWHISPLSPAPCEECIKTNGEQARITEKFSNGVMYPPLHPNCYCYLTYSVERKGKAVASDDATDEMSRKASGRWAPATSHLRPKVGTTDGVRVARSASEQPYRATQAESGEATNAPRDARRVNLVGGERSGRACADNSEATPKAKRSERVRRSASEANAEGGSPTPQKIICPKCKRFLMDASEVKIEKMICPNTKCKARLAVDTITDGKPVVKEVRKNE